MDKENLIYEAEVEKNSFPLGGIISSENIVYLKSDENNESEDDLVDKSDALGISDTKEVPQDEIIEVETENILTVSAVAVPEVLPVLVHEVRAVEVPIEATHVQSVNKDEKCKCATSKLFPHRKSKCALKNTSTKTALGVGAAVSVAAAGCVAVGAIVANEVSKSSVAVSELKDVKGENASTGDSCSVADKDSSSVSNSKL